MRHISLHEYTRVSKISFKTVKNPALSLANFILRSEKSVLIRIDYWLNAETAITHQEVHENDCVESLGTVN